jgi:hypothetical protein
VSLPPQVDMPIEMTLRHETTAKITREDFLALRSNSRSEFCLKCLPEGRVTSATEPCSLAWRQELDFDRGLRTRHADKDLPGNRFRTSTARRTDQ